MTEAERVVVDGTTPDRLDSAPCVVLLARVGSEIVSLPGACCRTILSHIRGTADVLLAIEPGGSSPEREFVPAPLISLRPAGMRVRPAVLDRVCSVVSNDQEHAQLRRTYRIIVLHGGNGYKVG